jgi:rare lipoprotein A
VAETRLNAKHALSLQVFSHALFKKENHMISKWMRRPPRSRLLLLIILASLWSCQAHTPDPPPHRDPITPEKLSTQREYEVFGQRYAPIIAAKGFKETGVASWYGDPFHGQPTANGEIYNMNARTAAHRTLPMGTFLKVRNMENNSEIIVRINDRGPFAKERIIDLSLRSAQEIDMVGNGTAPVEIYALDPDSPEIRYFIKTAHPDFFTGDFTVQVGAYADRGRAEALQRQLANTGKEAFVTPVTINGIPVYRVRVGAFASWDDAENLKDRLTQRGYENVFTVSAGN